MRGGRGGPRLRLPGPEARVLGRMGLTAVMARVAIVAVPLLAAVVLHEVAHGVVAYACGDPTAARAGRLTLNPLAHVDPVGTLLVPGLLLLMPLLLGTTPFVFGWAKPVPIDPRWFRRPRLDGLLVALAGPGTNAVLAVLSALVTRALAAPPPHAADPRHPLHRHPGAAVHRDQLRLGRVQLASDPAARRRPRPHRGAARRCGARPPIAPGPRAHHLAGRLAAQQ